MSQLLEFLLTEREAATYLAITISTLRRWRWAGNGPAYFRCGAVIRYAKADLDSFVANRSRKG